MKNEKGGSTSEAKDNCLGVRATCTIATHSYQYLLRVLIYTKNDKSCNVLV